MSRTFTVSELAGFDGRDGRPAYVAYRGKVYDVTQSPHFAEGAHYGHDSGADLTEDMDEAPHEEDVIEGLEVVGVLGS
jgi:predicted heme/steroid binding protein